MSAQGRYIDYCGESYLNFNTTAYLGLTHHPSFKKLFIDGVQLMGVSHGSSPLTQPQHHIYRELEALLANYYGCESALLFATGFQASRALVSYFHHGLKHEIVYEKNAHPALRIRLQEACKKKIMASDLVNPIFPQICKIDGASSIVDASHGFGVVDNIIKEKLAEGHIVCGSLNKGFSTTAGVVLCDSAIKKGLETSPFYNTASPPNPAGCYALLHAFKNGLVKEQQVALAGKINLIPESESFASHPKLPIVQFYDSSEKLYLSFLKKKMLLWHNQYPKQTGEYVNRAVIHAALQEEDILKLFK